MRRAPLAVVLLLLPGVLACFAGGYRDQPRLVGGLAVWALLAAAALLAPHPLPRSRAAWAALGGLAALAAWVALSITWAPLGEPAGKDAQRLLVYVGALGAGLALLRGPAVRLVEPLLLLAITGAILYGLSDRLLPGVVALDAVLSAGDRLAQPLTYWNGTGAFAALGLLLAAGLAGEPERPRALRAAAVAAAPPLGLALYLTFSRGALGALAAGLAVLLALAPERGRGRAAVLVVAAAAVPGLATVALPAVATAASSNGQGAAMLGLLLVLAALAAGLEARARPAPGRLDWMRPAAIGALVLALAVTGFAVGRREHGPGRDTPAASPTRLASVQSNRYAYWRVALRTFGEHPLRGVGSGGFAAVWLRERPFAEPVRDAHSLYLETAAELGVVGLALLALVIGGVAAAARRVGPALPGATAALCAFALHAAVDWDWELPALSLVALLLAALLLTSREAGGALDGRAP